jgi:hypothetical protein
MYWIVSIDLPVVCDADYPLDYLVVFKHQSNIQGTWRGGCFELISTESGLPEIVEKLSISSK